MYQVAVINPIIPKPWTNLAIAKTSSAPGPDMIEFGIFKHLDEQGQKIHMDVLNTILDGHDIPEGLKQMEIFMIHKGGDPANLNNYRGISLLNTLFKSLTNIINRRKTNIKEAMGVFMDGQGGGRPNRTCGGKVQTIINCIAEAKRLSKQLIVISFDVVKAYDKIHPTAIYDAFNVLGYGQDYINLFKHLYSGFKVKVQTAFGLTESFTYASGLMQGDGGSPSTYCEFMELLLRWLEANNIHYLFERKFKSDRSAPFEFYVDPMAWLDDLVLLVSPEQAQFAIDLVVEFFAAYKMAINSTKTKYMCINCDLNLQNKSNPAEPKDLYKVNKGEPMRILGYYITDDLSWNKHEEIILKECDAILSRINNAKIDLKAKSYLINFDVFGKAAFSADIVPFKNLVPLKSKVKKAFLKGVLAQNISPDYFYLLGDLINLKLIDIEAWCQARSITGFLKCINGYDETTKMTTLMTLKDIEQELTIDPLAKPSPKQKVRMWKDYPPNFKTTRKILAKYDYRIINSNEICRTWKGCATFLNTDMSREFKWYTKKFPNMSTGPVNHGVIKNCLTTLNVLDLRSVLGNKWASIEAKEACSDGSWIIQDYSAAGGIAFYQVCLTKDTC